MDALYESIYIYIYVSYSSLAADWQWMVKVLKLVEISSTTTIDSGHWLENGSSMCPMMPPCISCESHGHLMDRLWSTFLTPNDAEWLSCELAATKFQVDCLIPSPNKFSVCAEQCSRLSYFFPEIWKSKLWWLVNLFGFLRFSAWPLLQSNCVQRNPG